ncbi:MAG: hypothetical protein ACR2F8_04365 [Caulobacteraceae bacterium]
MKRIFAAILTLVLGVNGLVMLLAGQWWYGAVPGVTATGPYNPHFVMDIGAAYLVVAGALAWRAARPAAGQGAAIAAAAYLILHALIHLVHATLGGHFTAELVRDFPGVYLPALLTAWVAWPTRRQS